MPLTPTQQAKLEAAIGPLYADVDFAGVTDILAEVTQTPPQPQSETDSFDVLNPATTAPATPTEPELPADPSTAS